LDGEGEVVRAVAEAIAAARKWSVLRSSVGEVEVGAGAERKGGSSELVGRGWKLVGWSRKDRSFVCRVGATAGVGETGVEEAAAMLDAEADVDMVGEAVGRSSKSNGPLVRRRGTSTVCAPKTWELARDLVEA